MGQGPLGCPRLSRGWQCRAAGCRQERWVPCRGVPARGPAGTSGAAVGSGRSRQSPGRRDSPLCRSQHRADHAALPCLLAALRQSAVELGRFLAPPGLRDGGGDSGDLPRGLGRHEDESRRRECFEDKKHPCVIPRQPRTAPRTPPGTAGAACAGEVPLLLVMLVHPTGPDGCWGRWYQSHQCLHPGDPARTPALLLPPSISSHGGGAVATNSSTRARSQPAWRGHLLANATCMVVVMGR